MALQRFAIRPLSRSWAVRDRVTEARPLTVRECSGLSRVYRDSMRVKRIAIAAALLGSWGPALQGQGGQPKPEVSASETAKRTTRAPAAFEFKTLAAKTVSGDLEAWDKAGLRVSGRRVDTSALWHFRGPAGQLKPVGSVKVAYSGGELCGEVVGGDPEGEFLTVQTPALGRVRVELDHVRMIRVRQRGVFYDEQRYAPKPGDKDKESVYRETALGLDPVLGILVAVDEKGVRFEWGKREELFGWKKLAGLRLPAIEDQKGREGATVVLLLNDGSRVTGKAQGVASGKLKLESRLGVLSVPLVSILAGHVEDSASRAWLSAAKPAKVEERGFFGGAALYPHRKDRNVLGSELRVQRRYWTNGLGTHSYSALTFVAPEGAKRFLAMVGADDSAILGQKLGRMTFRVLRNGEVAAEQKAMKGGQRAASLAVVQVKPGDTLQLVLDFGPELHILDRGNWLAPVFAKR